MHKIFSFKGITRNNSHLAAAEGECLDILNMRMKEGSLVPVPVPETEAALEYPYSKIVWHEMTGHYLCVTDDSDAVLHIYDKEWKPIKQGSAMNIFPLLAGVTAIELLGYIVCCITGRGMFYLLYDNGAYKWLGERPPMPELKISVESKLLRIVTPEAYHSSANSSFESSWEYNAKGYFDECIAMHNQNGRFIDRALFRFALRMFDGSYICASPVLYVSDEEVYSEVARDSNNLVAENLSGDSSAKYTVSVLGFKPLFAFENLNLYAWRNIIMSIDIFTTGSIMGKKADEFRGMRYDGVSGGNRYVTFDRYTAKSLDELAGEISSASVFYKIAEYSIEGKLVDSVDNVSQTNLVLQQSLADDNSCYSSIAPSCSYVFNSRLHIGSLREWFSKGYELLFLNTPLALKQQIGKITAVTRIKTLSGHSVVKRVYENVLLSRNSNFYELPALLSYPDSRAYEMVLFVLIDGKCYSRTFPLAAHRSLNIALYVNKWHMGLKVSVKGYFAKGASLYPVRDEVMAEMFAYKEGVHEVVFSASAGELMYNGETFPAARFSNIRLVSDYGALADGDKIVCTLLRCDDKDSYSDVRNISIDSSWSEIIGVLDFDETEPYEERRNVLKVSPADNPFTFPAAMTYAPSQGEVVALASNTVAISQGQFGQHPLYVFCNDGIWAMAVDATGSMAYTASYPLSREICVNADTVCGVDSGVVFAGEQGVMLLSGGKMQPLSLGMEGGEPLSDISGNPIVSKLYGMMGFSGMHEYGSFKEYLHGAVAAYLPSHGEVLFANRNYGFCYIFSLRSALWSRVVAAVSGFVRSNSFLKAFQPYGSGSKVLVMSKEHSGNNSVLLLTRPQTWGAKLHKRIMQLLLHTYAKPNPIQNIMMPVVACYLLGSNDGVHFGLIAGKECDKEIQDLKFPYFPTQAYKYYIFAVCGQLGTGSRVSGIEIEMQPAWHSRM